MPHQPRADAVHRRRAQRLAVQRAAEEEVERARSARRWCDDQQALHADVDAAEPERFRRERRRARALGAEEPEPEAQSARNARATETMSSTSTLASASGWYATGRAAGRARVTSASVSRICAQNGSSAARATTTTRGDRRAERPVQRASCRGMPAALRRARRQRIRFHRARDDRHADEQADGAGRLAELQAGERQRAVGDELAGRHPDHARDGEDQHQRQREQRVDRAVGDAVLRQQREDRRGPCGSRQRRRPTKKAGCGRRRNRPRSCYRLTSRAPTCRRRS